MNQASLERHASRICGTLNKARKEIDPQRVKQVVSALREEDRVQITGTLQDVSCGGMCVLGVIFSTLLPDMWEDFVVKGLDNNTLANDDWDVSLGIALTGDDNFITANPFWSANDDGVTFTQFADILDGWVAQNGQ